MKIIKVVGIILFTFSLIGCAGSFVSVEQKFGSHQNLFGSKKAASKGFHIVKQGETLYSIAWQHGLDYRAVASANSIPSPYTIYPGQRISVSGRMVAANKSVANKPKAKPSAPVKSPSAPAVVAKKPTATPKTPPNIPPAADDSMSYTPPPAPANTQAQWVWPANGRLIERFSASEPVNKGIDIGGSLGESIYAAMAGTVVYAGKGLRGYGNLVIVKHNDTYLSAYAHANRVLVKEQQAVKAGEKIAEIGSTGTDKVKLHFEIRQNGKPVDPLLHLPKRAGG